MKYEEISKKFKEIDSEISSLQKNIIDFFPESQRAKSDVSSQFLKLETSIVSMKNLIRSLPQPISRTSYIIAVMVAFICGISITLYASTFPGWIPVIETSDVPVDMFAEYDPHLYRVHIGDVAGTTSEYSKHFNQTFIGFVTDVNVTNRSETALITLKNRDEEITLNEYWIQSIDEEWFERNYNVDFNQYPDHYPDYNGTYQFTGTYQLTNNLFEPVSKDWNIIHTVDGKIRLEYYKVDGTERLYYYNSTYPGGAEVEYINGKFIIIYSQEEIEYERIL
ncbi:hypothetical protein KAU33_02570 [Candidatus Dependentiae bacterium]|nr:hypothetical protein [Candidatus Dependentiae bacterium]